MTTIELFSHLSNIVTVIVFLFAAYQFFLWRKQQRYSLEMEALLNMEDLFEIYMASLMRTHGYFDKADKLASEAKDKTVEDRQNFDAYMHSRFKDALVFARREVNEQSKSYSLARYRVIRLNFDIDKKNELDPEWLEDRFDEFLEKKNSLEQVAEKISKIKKVAYEEFKRLRSSI